MTLLHSNFRVKSISASKFTPEEIKMLQEGGNGVVAKIWLATHDRLKDFEPNLLIDDEVLEYMRQKYVQKKWYRSSLPADAGNDVGADLCDI